MRAIIGILAYLAIVMIAVIIMINELIKNHNNKLR